MVEVTGIVRNVWSVRDVHAVQQSKSGSNSAIASPLPDSDYTTDDFNSFTSDGPLARDRSYKINQVFSLSISSYQGGSFQRRETNVEVMLYFYDIWAQKCSFLMPGDQVTVSGPSTMVTRQFLAALIGQILT